MSNTAYQKPTLEALFKKLPEKAFRTNDDRSPKAAPIIAIKRGESGYYPIFARATADELNAMEGVTKEQAEAMYNGSLFGWDTPGADPDYPMVRDIVQRRQAAAKAQSH